MDDIVKAAMAKWPRVPDCRGWLALDARGDWYLRDLQAQRAGAFPQSKGSRVDHAMLKAFIGRNYQSDPQGCWYFQNGPQKVFVELECAPWVFGVQRQAGGFGWHTHTGQDVGDVHRVWTDEGGRLFLRASCGLGLVASTDMLAASDWLEASGLTVETTAFSALPAMGGFVLSPALAAEGMAAGMDRP